MPDGEPREEEVTEALRRLLAWPDIARSGQLARFLNYIVDRKLRGDAQSIKAYSIAVDVFGRPPDFDPQTDPIVRVQARRLRGLIEQFYRSEGAADEVRIDLPTGRYVPEFVRYGETAGNARPGNVESDVDLGAPADRGRRPSLSGFLLGVATAGLGAAVIAAFFMWGPRVDVETRPAALIDPPSVLVTEFQILTGDMTDLSMVAGLSIELVTDLDQFETLSVRYGGSVAMDAAPATDYVLSGIVRREGGGLQYSAILTETATGSVVWNKAIALDADDMGRADLVDYVSGRLSLVLGSPRGPLHRRARALVNDNAVISGGENLYLCRVMFDLYRERGTPGSGLRAQSCFAALDEAERGSGLALAAMASLLAEGAADGGSGDLTPEERRLRAGALLAEAVEMAPTSGFVWEQRARFYELEGRHDLAEAAYSSALQINPANSDALAGRARHLALLGRWEAASRLNARAFSEPTGQPSWYYCVPALEALRQGNYRQAVNAAEIYAEADRELGPILAVMAGQGLGDTNIVNRYLPRVLDLASFRGHGVLTQLRSRVTDEALLRDIRVALLSAGVPPTALNGPF